MVPNAPFPRVRTATLRDVPAIRGLLGQLGYDVGEEALAERVSRLMGNDGHLLLVATGDRDKPVGLLHAFRRDAIEKPPQVTVQSLVVDASARRLGLARALMEAAEDWAATMGVAELGLSTRIDRAQAHAFYESIGYARVSTAHQYAKAQECV